MSDGIVQVTRKRTALRTAANRNCDTGAGSLAGPAAPLLRVVVRGGDGEAAAETGLVTLAAVASALSGLGWSGTEVGLTRPTLEDTFLSLTGRQMRVGDAA